MASQTPVSHAISAAELARMAGFADCPCRQAFAASQHSICGSLDRRQRDLTTESQTWPPKELAR